MYTFYQGGLVSVWLMGCHDRDRQSWCTVTKCGNGFDDERLNKLQGELLPLMDKIKQDYSRCECPNIQQSINTVCHQSSRVAEHQPRHGAGRADPGPAALPRLGDHRGRVQQGRAPHRGRDQHQVL